MFKTMVVHYNLREQVLNNLGRQIIGGELSPADVLPKEDTLSEQYGVSRTVIREAVKGLAARGLVASRPKVGTIIRPQNDWQMLDPAVLEWIASTESESTFLLRIAQARLAIEPSTAELAARHATDEDIAAIEEAYKQLEEAIDDYDAWAEVDLAFHASIVAACHNEFLAYIVRSLRRPLYSMRRLNVPLMKLLESSEVAEPHGTARDEVLAGHFAVMDAIRNYDEASARKASTALLERVVSLLAQQEEA